MALTKNTKLRVLFCRLVSIWQRNVLCNAQCSLRDVAGKEFLPAVFNLATQRPLQCSFLVEILCWERGFCFCRLFSIWQRNVLCNAHCSLRDVAGKEFLPARFNLVTQHPLQCSLLVERRCWERGSFQFGNATSSAMLIAR